MEEMSKVDAVFVSDVEVTTQGIPHALTFVSEGVEALPIPFQIDVRIVRLLQEDLPAFLVAAILLFAVPMVVDRTWHETDVLLDVVERAFLPSEEISLV